MRWMVLAALLAGCGAPAFPPCGLADAEAAGPVAWVVDIGWHTEIGLPTAQLSGPLAVFRGVFPQAAVLFFGFGKRDFFTMQQPESGDFVLGTIPGPAAVQVLGLRVPPGRAFPGRTVRLALPPGGSASLSAFLWDAVAHPADGQPVSIAPGLYPGTSLFYGATRGYSLGYTCNTWTADALRHAGLPVDADVVFAGGTMRQVARVTGACMARPD